MREIVGYCYLRKKGSRRTDEGEWEYPGVW